MTLFFFVLSQRSQLSLVSKLGDQLRTSLVDELKPAISNQMWQNTIGQRHFQLGSSDHYAFDTSLIS